MPSLQTLVLMDRTPHRPSHHRLFSLLLALFLGLGLSLSGFSMASAQVPPAIQRAPANTPIVYHGGPIESDPEVLLDFWGPNWANAYGQSQITTIVGLFSSLSGGSYLNILRMYGVHNHVTLVNVGGAAYYHDTTSIGPITSAANDQVAITAMERAQQAAGLSATTFYPNLQVMIFPDSTAIYAPPALNGCGWHGSDASGTRNVYSVIEYQTNTNNCKLNNSYSGDPSTALLEAIATHEFAEAVTDPQSSTGWSEIGDQCGGDNMTYTPPNQPANAIISYVTQELSNLAGDCVPGYGTAYPSPDVAPPYVGQHTIPSYMVGTYTTYQSMLGEPLTEQEDVNNGGVVYFSAPAYCSGYTLPPGSYGSVGVVSGAGIYYSPSTGSHELNGCIFQYYQSPDVGGPANANGLGFPVSDEVDAPYGGGRVNYFGGHGCGNTSPNPYGSGSAIYWNYSTGTAYYVQGCIYGRYQAACGDGTTQTCSQILGLPVTSEIATSNGGHVSYFAGKTCNGGIATLVPGVYTGSAIYSANGAGNREVQGCIFTHYFNLGGPDSFLGYPTSDEHLIAGGYVSNFQGTPCGSQSWGHIFYIGATGAHEVHGCIDNAYLHTYGGPSGFLGFPTSDQLSIGNSTVSNFQGTGCGSASFGQIYADISAGIHEVHGCIDSKYLRCGGAAGPLGFPISDEQPIPGDSNPSDREELFQNGYIFWQNGAPTVIFVGVSPSC